MRFFKCLLSSLASISFVSANADTDGSDADIPYIEVVGNKFFYSNNGSQFYIKGIAYQQDTSNSSSSDTTFVDPLSDASTCERDLPYLVELHTNVLRVYALNTSVSHKECMDLFANAGIYIIADLSEPSLSIDRSDPQWNLELYQRYTDVVDAMSNYTNVLGFFAGNEVTNDYTNTDASAFVKAAVRDTKQYISDQGYRTIPVGYSSNDDSDTRVPMADYFDCGDESERVDFYGINMYEWCGNSTFEESGYQARTEEFSNLTVPIFFSEYGCNAVRPREFTEIGTLYSDDMTDVWSGGIVYMYYEEDNNYGLVSIDNDKVSTLEDFNYLKTQLANIDPSIATSSDQSSTATLACPSEYIDWRASTDLPPTPDEDVCDCLLSGLSCIVSSDVSSDDYGDLYGTVCGHIDCSDINSNGTTGSYGAYSYCDDKTKLSYLLNKYYEENDSASSNCDFDGSATLGGSSSTASTCTAVLSQASAEASSGSSSSGSGSGSGSSGSGSSGSSSTSSKSSSTASGSSSSSGSSSGAYSVRPSVDSATLALLVTAATFFVGGLGAAAF